MASSGRRMWEVTLETQANARQWETLGTMLESLSFISLDLSFLTLNSFKCHTFFLIIIGDMAYVAVSLLQMISY